MVMVVKWRPAPTDLWRNFTPNKSSTVAVGWSCTLSEGPSLFVCVCECIFACSPSLIVPVFTASSFKTLFGWQSDPGLPLNNNKEQVSISIWAGLVHDSTSQKHWIKMNDLHFEPLDFLSSPVKCKTSERTKTSSLDHWFVLLRASHLH